MNPQTITQNAENINLNADWYLVFDAAYQVGEFASLDDIFHRALDVWLTQLAPALRWEIAIKLYTGDQISTGRAAEIAGLNYVVFMEKLRENNIPFMAAEPATGEQREKVKALIHGGFNLKES